MFQLLSMRRRRRRRRRPPVDVDDARTIFMRDERKFSKLIHRRR